MTERPEPDATQERMDKAARDLMASAEFREAAGPRTLGDALPAEMARVRDDILPLYIEIGPDGGIAVAMMRRDLDMAARAMAEGDVVAMIRALNELRGWKA